MSEECNQINVCMCDRYDLMPNRDQYSISVWVINPSSIISGSTWSKLKYPSMKMIPVMVSSEVGHTDMFSRIQFPDHSWFNYLFEAIKHVDTLWSTADRAGTQYCHSTLYTTEQISAHQTELLSLFFWLHFSTVEILCLYSC